MACVCLPVCVCVLLRLGVCVHACVCFQLPRAVNTQALSGAGFLKMINKASDAVNKMTIKMNESDTVRRLWMFRELNCTRGKNILLSGGNLEIDLGEKDKSSIFQAFKFLLLVYSLFLIQMTH